MDQWQGRADEPDHQDATVKIFHYDDLESLKAHVTAYSCAKQLKELPWRTPYQVICEASQRPVNFQDRPAPPHSGTTHLAVPLLMT